jgi:hypothetical protein
MKPSGMVTEPVKRAAADNQSCLNILSWCWVKEAERYVIVVHFSGGTAPALVHLPWDELRGKTWRLADALSGETHDRNGNEMSDAGLYVDLGPWGFHFFCMEAL